MAITDLGLLASGGSRTANQSTFSVFTTAAVAKGELLVAYTVVDVAGTSSGIDASTYDLRIGGTNGDRFLDRLSNQPGTGSQTGVACSLWWMIAPQAYASGTEIIAKYNSPTESDHSALTVRHYGIGLGNIVTQVGGNSGTITTAVQPSTIDIPTANLTLLRVRGCGMRYPSSPTTLVQFTQTSGWIAYTAPQSGPITSSPDWEVVAGLESVIFTGTSKPSSPTVVQPSAQHTNVYVALQETPCTGTLAVTERSLVSAGPNLIATPLVWTPSGVTISGTTTLTFAETGGGNAYHSASKPSLGLPAGNYCLSVDYQGTGPSPRNFQAWVFGGSPSHYVACTVAADGTLLDTLVDTPYFTFGQATVSPAGGGFWNVQIIFSTTTTVDEIDLYVIKPPTTQYYAGLNDGSGIQVRNVSLRATTADVAGFSGYAGFAATGTLAATEVGDSASFPGSVLTVVPGTIEAYEGAVWPTADSTLYTADDNVTRVSFATIIRDTAAFTGQVLTGPYGVFAATEASDTAAFAATVGRSGILNATDVADTAAFAGMSGLIGVLAATESTTDTAAFTATAVTYCALAVTDGADIAAFAVTARMNAALAVTEGSDTAAFTAAAFFPLTGSLGATEAADDATFTVAVSAFGTLAVAEVGADTSDFIGLITNQGALAATEVGADLAAFAGSVAWAATLAATESTSDSAAFTVKLAELGTAAATEGADTVLFEGWLSKLDEKVGQLHANEDRLGGYSEPRADSTLVTADNALYHASIDYYGMDRAFFTGGISVTATMSAVEGAKDSATFSINVPLGGILGATEARDVAAFSGAVGAIILAVLDAHEARDFALFSEPILDITGVLAAVEDADTAHFSMPSWEAVGEENRLKNEQQRTVWLTGQGGRVTWLENEVEDTPWLQNLDPEVISLLAEQERITRLGA